MQERWVIEGRSAEERRDAARHTFYSDTCPVGAVWYDEIGPTPTPPPTGVMNRKARRAQAAQWRAKR